MKTDITLFALGLWYFIGGDAAMMFLSLVWILEALE